MLEQQFVIVPLSIFIFLTSSCLMAGDAKKCPTNIKYLKEVSDSMLEGSWYMQSRYIPQYPVDYRCHKTDITPGTHQLNIKTFQINDNDESKQVTNEKLIFLPDGQFYTSFDDKHAYVSSASSSSSAGGLDIDWDKITHKIISLDCNKLIIYSCQDLPNDKHVKMLWVYTTRSHPSEEVIREYKKVAETYGFNVNLLESISHEPCFRYVED
ncbi:uncharacterized protein [Eurosta solidaginis]|uniref:uncharacterized protein isoform X1 n=1 Tax=Eurosta solidaginis TaxID=178769 RepID=UPI0035312848